MNLRKAAEIALEALQDTCDHLPARSGVEREVDDAITALRQALAMDEQTSLELCDRCGWKGIMPDEGCLVCARRKQEPVAIVNEGMGGLEWLSEPLADDTPLYTAPLISDYHEGWEEGFKAGKREWVGLTTAEVIRCQEAYYFDTYQNIEAELKEKNT